MASHKARNPKAPTVSLDPWLLKCSGSVIDNLTATIVCIKILKRVVPHRKDRSLQHAGLLEQQGNHGNHHKVMCWTKSGMQIMTCEGAPLQ